MQQELGGEGSQFARTKQMCWMTLLDIGFESLFISGEHEVQQGMVNIDGSLGELELSLMLKGAVGTQKGQRYHRDNAE